MSRNPRVIAVEVVIPKEREVPTHAVLYAYDAIKIKYPTTQWELLGIAFKDERSIICTLRECYIEDEKEADLKLGDALEGKDNG